MFTDTNKYPGKTKYSDGPDYTLKSCAGMPLAPPFLLILKNLCMLLDPERCLAGEVETAFKQIESAKDQHKLCMAFSSAVR